ncbi:MAG: DUF459 domain-containing protein [Actinobacteria bacterium]|nr:DUF459 domain-containing protein [Actinomycetota bacterium]
MGLVSFALGAVLNADSLSGLANRQPFGWKRDVARALVAPIRWTSRTTGLDRPRRWIQEVAGKDTSVGNGSGEFVVPTSAPSRRGSGSGSAPGSTPGPGARPGSGSGGGGGGGGGASPGTVPAGLRLRRPTSSQPLRVWIGGDSMAQELGASLVTKLNDTKAYAARSEYHVSTGLTRPDYFDWPGYLAEKILPTRPEVVVVIFGANDAQRMEVDGKSYDVDDGAWQTEYRRRVGLIMDQLGSDGRLVVWVGTPRMRSSSFDRRQGVLDGIYADEAKKRPFVRFVDSRPVLSPAGGGYTAYLPDGKGGQALARQGDGVHLSLFGADVLATAVQKVIDADVPGRAPSPPGGAPPGTAPPGSTQPGGTAPVTTRPAAGGG